MAEKSMLLKRYKRIIMKKVGRVMKSVLWFPFKFIGEILLFVAEVIGALFD